MKPLLYFSLSKPPFRVRSGGVALNCPMLLCQRDPSREGSLDLDFRPGVLGGSRVGIFLGGSTAVGSCKKDRGCSRYYLQAQGTQ